MKITREGDVFSLQGESGEDYEFLTRLASPDRQIEKIDRTGECMVGFDTTWHAFDVNLKSPELSTHRAFMEKVAPTMDWSDP